MASARLAVIDLAAARLRVAYDCSTYALAGGSGLRADLQGLAVRSGELIVERVPARAVLATMSLPELLQADLSPQLPLNHPFLYERWHELLAYLRGEASPRPWWLPE